MSAAGHADTGAGRAPAVVPLMIVGWVWVSVPFAYGLYRLLIKIPDLFGG